MQFGIHSLLFTETFVDKDLPLLEKFKTMGFDAVEIIPFDPDNFPARKVRAAAVRVDGRRLSPRAVLGGAYAAWAAASAVVAWLVLRGP